MIMVIISKEQNTVMNVTMEEFTPHINVTGMEVMLNDIHNRGT